MWTFGAEVPFVYLLLTAHHKALHLAGAQQNLHWTVYNWKHVAWSDESYFQLHRADGQIRVWRYSHEFIYSLYQGDVQYVQIL